MATYSHSSLPVEWSWMSLLLCLQQPQKWFSWSLIHKVTSPLSLPYLLYPLLWSKGPFLDLCSLPHMLYHLTRLYLEFQIGHQNLSCFLMLSSTCFIALSHAFPDVLPTLVSFTLSHDAWVLAWNQDQNAKIPNSLISDLLWISSRQLSKICNEITKGKRTLMVQMQINICTIKNLISKQTESMLNKLDSMQLNYEQINQSSKLFHNNLNFIT